MLYMQSDCCELVWVWVSCLMLFGWGQALVSGNESKGSVYCAFECVYVYWCVWESVRVHSEFTICTAFPFPVTHATQSRRARAAFRGTCLTKMSDSSLGFFLNDIYLLSSFSAKWTDMKSRLHFNTSSPPTQISSLSNLHYKPEAAPHCLTTWLSAFQLRLCVLPNTQEYIFFSTTGSHLEGSGASAGGVWRAGHRCQEISSPNHCVSQRICDKVYSREFRKKKKEQVLVG